MAYALSDSVIPEDYDYKTPEHLIIWLDAYIGDPEKYHLLKKSFSSNIDPRSQTWTMLTDRDYDILLRVNEAMPVSFGGVLCLLLTFTDLELCYAAIQKYQDKRILLITSGSLGKDIVPRIIQNFRQVFTDPVTNKPCSSVYIFCLDIPLHYDWAVKYDKYIQMFDHEADLLTRITRDMAVYYFTQADRHHQGGHLEEALRPYLWSKKLFLQCQKMNEPCKKDIDDIDSRTHQIEITLRPPRPSHEHDMQNNDDEEKGSQTCS